MALAENVSFALKMRKSNLFYAAAGQNSRFFSHVF